jgi:hypothetical protein
VLQLRQQGNKPLHNAVKGTVYTYTPSHITPSTAQDMGTVSKMGPMIVVGLLKLRIQRQNPPVGSAPPSANRVRDKVTQRVASSWHTWDPIDRTRHPQALYLNLSHEVSFMPLCVGRHHAACGKPVSIVLGLAIGGMPMSYVGLVTCGMHVSFSQFGYRCDSCELVALGCSWVTLMEIHA